MTHSQLNLAVAHATGEERQTISRLGFSLADPKHVRYDSDGGDRPPLIMDWDEFDRQRE